MASNVYTGIAFPFTKGTTSFPAAAVDDELIRQELTQLILTTRGERVMRPELGTDANNFIFETNNEILASTIRTIVANAIAKFDNRVVLRNIVIERVSSETGGDRLDSVIVTISYVVPVTQRQGTVSIQLGENAGSVET